jgi:hypothetical protein
MGLFRRRRMRESSTFPHFRVASEVFWWLCLGLFQDTPFSHFSRWMPDRIETRMRNFCNRQQMMLRRPAAIVHFRA